eukprot:6132023-Prymnesium_polylepis.1
MSSGECIAAATSVMSASGSGETTSLTGSPLLAARRAALFHRVLALPVPRPSNSFAFADLGSSASLSVSTKRSTAAKRSRSRVVGLRSCASSMRSSVSNGVISTRRLGLRREVESGIYDRVGKLLLAALLRARGTYRGRAF